MGYGSASGEKRGAITNYASQHCPLFGPGKLVTDNEITRYDIYGELHVGADTAGHDVKFFGATTAKYFLWDESADKLIILGTADLGTSCEADAYTVGAVAGVDRAWAAITSATSMTVVKGIVTSVSG